MPVDSLLEDHDEVGIGSDETVSFEVAFVALALEFAAAIGFSTIGAAK